MKNLIFIPFLLWLLTGCRKDETMNPNEPELSPFIIENYSQDARQLYFREILADSTHPDHDNPVMDSLEIDRILKIFQAVYNSRSPESNTVFNVYRIHVFSFFSFSSIMLEVDPGLPEIQNLSEGIIPTGEPALDQLLETWHFDSVSPSPWYPDYPWLTLVTCERYNMLPVAEAFRTLGVVTSANIVGYVIGDGNDITLTFDGNEALIVFSTGEGDCPSGCTEHTYREFSVRDGKARFIRTY
ncbi:MAG: hypothetical protein ACOYXB_16495 [Bacteroidota bacterium]